jgi:hypothetical protein
VMTQLVNWLVTRLSGTRDRNAYIQRCAEGFEPVDLPSRVASTIARYAPVAVVMNEFYRRLYRESRTVPYPVEDIRRACATAGFQPHID